MRPAGAGLTPRVAAVRDRLEALTGQRYDSVLINLYEDGKCGMRYHVDPLVRMTDGWMGREGVAGGGLVGESWVRPGNPS
jgi:hypothetical protein